MNKRRLSSMRKRLRQLLTERAACEQIAMDSPPMVAASFLERTFRPGQPQPYCYLSASINGKSRHRYVPMAQAPTWRRRAERWQQFSHAMTRWVKCNREIEQLLRSLGRERCVPLPKATARKSPTRPRRGER
jgi:hypothetical protein